ncbi:MAG: SWIM zinc finger family protein [Planctomycetaceae bacterium]
MTLSELLESRFRGDIRFRGAAYLQAERVAITRVTSEQVFGSVRDGVEYHTHLVRDNGSLMTSCSCQTANGSANCKHVWATILAVDGGSYLPGGVKPGHIPPFAVEEDPVFSAEDLWEEDELPEDFLISGSLEPPRQTASAGATGFKRMGLRLSDLKKSLAGRQSRRHGRRARPADLLRDRCPCQRRGGSVVDPDILPPTPFQR